ncbi:hypothetical protein CDAR_441581 [Caerostris darwini]|uniref:Uncharacterized protein n=1 Tax=Caerostris darwini TaxID=1538125 RepID=A0AAV4QT05_9ARAC|nr:hypothetical protein CDAR_441581 [Caerostris darwini]
MLTETVVNHLSGIQTRDLGSGSSIIAPRRGQGQPLFAALSCDTCALVPFYSLTVKRSTTYFRGFIGATYLTVYFPYIGYCFSSSFSTLRFASTPHSRKRSSGTESRPDILYTVLRPPKTFQRFPLGHHSIRPSRSSRRACGQIKSIAAAAVPLGPSVTKASHHL